MDKFKGDFSLNSVGYPNEEDSDEKNAEKAWISCGDHQWWHINVWQIAITKRYGEDSCTEIKTDEDETMYFEYDENVDLELISKDVGVSHSSMSVSSSSTDANYSPSSSHEDTN